MIRSSLISMAVLLFTALVWAQPEPLSPQAQQVVKEMGPGMARVALKLGDGNPGAGTDPSTLTSGKIFSTPQTRTAAGAELVPAINRLLVLFQQMDAVGTDLFRQADTQEATFLIVVKLALSNPQGREAYRKSSTDEAATTAILAAADYLMAGHDPASQLQAIDHLEAAYKSVPLDAPFQNVPKIFSKNPPAQDAVNRLDAFLRADTHSRFNKSIANAIQRQSISKSIMNQPLAVKSTLVDGSEFSTENWKGKVVLVYFWGAACAPCLEEIQEIKRFYPALHAKGLEVVGYSCDDSLKPVQAYLDKNRGVTWPQIFDAKHPGWDAVAQSFGMQQGTPVTFFIDRKGILRDVDYGLDKNLAAKLGKLLAEAP